MSFLNNNGKIKWTKYLYLNDIGDFWFPLLALLALSPMSFKKGPFFCTYYKQNMENMVPSVGSPSISQFDKNDHFFQLLTYKMTRISNTFENDYHNSNSVREQ